MRHEHVLPQVGESPYFHFENRWLVDARADEVWAVLSKVDDWPHWWPGLASADTDGADVVTGSRARLGVRSPIGLNLDFEIELQRVEPAELVCLRATGGLRGTGVWALSRTGPLTVIDSVWCVTTTRRSIRLLRPISSIMHTTVMRAGQRGLAAQLSREAGRS